ncbi:hypothetical protein TNCT_249681 [Trichonephila clavata]|uniref:Uncharacterized protein n=1 Tax=Trichonephila clavata TaxID=2740835 RepID=A0A8X6FIM1_TRICU|nr:hypothetical protein TNCT_249681 [Trichonephila clavata]
MVDRIMAAAGPTSSIHVIDAENQDLKTMLMEISSHVSRLETHEQPVDPKDVSVTYQPAGNPELINIVSPLAFQATCYKVQKNHVPSRLKARATVT